MTSYYFSGREPFDRDVYQAALISKLQNQDFDKDYIDVDDCTGDGDDDHYHHDDDGDDDELMMN